ncbi:biotin/lipoyl-binding protein, partial [Pseudomonas aeruginosa]|uniref:biotin/lipoyl-binding protein n=1 Tax=Pseudomonas aeruginosa TaxID=287 RepID=UPI0020D0B407
VASQLGARVEEVLVRDNQHVDKGQLLVRLEDADFKLAVERAQLAGHPRDLALDVGVVGAFHVAADEPPVQEEGQGDQADGH